MKPSQLYLFLSILGAVLPYYFFVPFLLEYGLDLSEMKRQLFTNRISLFFGVDVILSAVVLLGFIWQESRRSVVRYAWLAVAGTLLIGVSFGLPLFLYLREQGKAHKPT